jgi:hypothetical protein
MLERMSKPASERTTRPPRSARTQPRIVVLYEAHARTLDGVHERLVRAGYEVHREQRYRDAAPWLVRHPDAVIVAVLPGWVALRRSVLEALRQLRPRAPLVAIVPDATAEVLADLEIARVAQVLTRDAAEVEIVAAVAATTELALSQPPPPSLPSDSQRRSTLTWT